MPEHLKTWQALFKYAGSTTSLKVLFEFFILAISANVLQCFGFVSVLKQKLMRTSRFSRHQSGGKLHRVPASPGSIFLKRRTRPRGIGTNHKAFKLREEKSVVQKYCEKKIKRMRWEVHDSGSLIILRPRPFSHQRRSRFL